MCQATIKKLSNHFESCQVQKVASLLTEALRGSCANMGTVGMETLCTELQEMGRSEELRAAPGLIARLEEEFRRVRAVFEEELSKNS
jgi:HPt (histidine-containing phosphotransfer) domain-containing protein